LPDAVPKRSIDFTGYGVSTGSAIWTALVIALDSTGRDTTFPIALNSQGNGSIVVDGWNRYRSVILATINTGQKQQSFKFSVASLEDDTLQIAAGQSATLVKMDGDLILTLTAASPISSVLEFSYTTSGLTTNEPAGWGGYYDLRFLPDIGNAIQKADFVVRLDAAHMNDLRSRGLRPEDLACFWWDSTASSWSFQSAVVVNRQDSTMRFSVPKTGIVGLFRNPGIAQKFVAYPSPADFRKTPRVYFPLQNGKTLSIYTFSGLLVRRLNGANSNEFDVNRFTWDGKNQSGGNVNSGLYYAVGSDSTTTHRAKLIVVR
jgi:hypothetical protein